MAATALPPVTVDFQAGGVRDVLRAFDSIENRAERYERQRTSASQRGGQARATSAQREERLVYDAHVKSTEAWTRQRARIVENSMRMASRLRDREVREEQQAADRVAREKERAAERGERAREKEYRESVRYIEQTARAEERAADRAAAAQERAERRHAAASRRAVLAQDRAAYGSRRQMSSTLLGAAGESLGGMVKGAVALGAGALTFGGGYTVAESLRNGMSEEAAAVSLLNSLPNEQAKGVTARGIQGKGRAIEALTHIDRTQAIEGLHAYVAKTGDASFLQPGDQTVMQIAKLAKATGSNFSELMSTAGLMKAQNLKITPTEMLDTLRIAAAQGMSGAVELSDLAHIGGKITASRGAYQMDQTEAQRKLLGLAQVVLPTAGSPDEAATVVSRFSQQALQHADVLQRLDPSLVDKQSGRLADPTKVINSVLGATGGNLGKIHDMGFKMEAIKLFEQLAPTYQEAFTRAGGSKGGKAAIAAGQAAITQQIESVTGARMTEGDVNERLQRVMDEKTERIEGAMQRLRDVIADRGMPILEKWINRLIEAEPKIEGFVNSVAKAADFFTEHPFASIFALMTTKMTADVAAAGIGAAIKAKLLEMLAGQALTNTTGSALTGVTDMALGVGAAGTLGGRIGLAVGRGARVAGAMAAPLAGAAAIYFTGKSTVNSAGGGAYIGEDVAQRTLFELNATRRGLAEGTITPEAAARGYRKVRALVSQYGDNASTAHGVLAAAQAPLAAVPGSFGEAARNDIASFNAARQFMSNADAITASLGKLKTALDALEPGGVASNAGANHSTRTLPIAQRPTQ